MDPAQARDRAYKKFFGAESESFVDDSETPNESGAPTIEVRRYCGRPPKSGSEHDVWVTAGMSDTAMVDDDGNPVRRELIFYALPGGDYSNALRSIACVPFENQTYLDHGHSVGVFGALFVPGGVDALMAENMESIALPHVVMLSPLIRKHQELSDELVIDNAPVEFLWVVPVSQAELDLKREEGMNALLDIFERNKHPWIFDPTRRSYI